MLDDNTAMIETAAPPAGRRNVSVATPAGRLDAEIFLPEAGGSGLPPLVALHGISRDAAAIAAAFANACLEQGRTLIVPRFARRQWPSFQRIEEARPDQALLGLLKTLRTAGFIGDGSVSLFGYSGGAQLAHRFAMLYPQRLSSIHIAAAGWYCVPDDTVPAPYGLGPAESKTILRDEIAKLSLAQLSVYLSLPVKVYVGERDIEQDPAMRSNDTVDRSQGLNRRERAERYVKRFADAAQAHGIQPHIELQLIPECAHDFSACAASGQLVAAVLSLTQLPN